MTRLVLVVLIFGLSTTQVRAQEPAAAPQNAVATLPAKAELLRRIDLYEAALRKPEIMHSDDASLATVYASLGKCYLDVAMYPKAEAAMQRAIALLGHGSPATLADETGQLAVLHVAMGDLKRATKDQMGALHIREQIGDPVGIALTWNDLASLYIRQRQYGKALDYAQRAMPLLASNLSVKAGDRIAIRQTLAYALCGVHQCARAIPLLQDALELARDHFGADSLAVGLASYLLGYTYWQSGQMDEAADWMQQGIERMKMDWGWGHTLYVNAVTQYSKFLRQRGQIESATLEERELRQMAAVVDARSLTSR
jgi:tetratricopeptide (TPR) repeat protein